MRPFNAREILRETGIRSWLFCALLALAPLLFMLNCFEATAARILSTPHKAATVFLASFAGVACIWMAVAARRAQPHRARDAWLILLPLLTLVWWRPPAWPAAPVPRMSEGLSLAIMLIAPATALLGSMISCRILGAAGPRQEATKELPRALRCTVFFVCAAALILIIRNYNTFAFFNATDFATYNQSFFNALRGRLLENSAYGSNFACHNSVSFALLLPLYASLPHPLTLIILRSLSLCAAALLFYRIIRPSLDEEAAVILAIAFLLYPYLASLHFVAPHEATWAALPILAAYLFFKRRVFGLFMACLCIVVGLKEHFAFLALAFGIAARAQRRTLRWSLTPAALGMIWLGLSLAVIAHFQRLYGAHPDAAWFLEGWRRRLAAADNALLPALRQTLLASNLAHPDRLAGALPLISSLGLILPLASPVALLGMPEAFVNLLAERPALLVPPWHYNVSVSCFFCLAAAGGISRLAPLLARLCGGLTRTQAQRLGAVCILTSSLMHAHLWLPVALPASEQEYVRSARQALALIPAQATVSVPRALSVSVSSRSDYAILERGALLEYVITDAQPLSERTHRRLHRQYRPIFEKSPIIVWKRK